MVLTLPLSDVSSSKETSKLPLFKKKKIFFFNVPRNTEVISIWFDLIFKIRTQPV